MSLCARLEAAGVKLTPEETNIVLRVILDHLHDSLLPTPIGLFTVTKPDPTPPTFTFTEPFTFSIPDIPERRAVVATESKLDPWLEPTPEALEALTRAYDKYFCAGMLQRLLNEREAKLQFAISNRLTSAAGTTSREGMTIIVRISKPILMSLTPEELKERPRIESDQVLTSRLHALQMTLEHELVHVFLLLVAPFAESHGSLFREVVKGLFGHTTTTHTLLSPPCGKLKREDLRVGMSIKYTDDDGALIPGTIIKVNKSRVIVSTTEGNQNVPISRLGV